MPDRPARTRAKLALVSASVLLLVGLPRQAAAQSPPVLPEVYGGTVRAVEPATGALELISGVGHALRIMRMGTMPATRAMSGGAAIRIADIKPGDVLHVECHMTDGGMVADRIERVPAPETAP
jgi:hypothetical protein